MSSTATAAREEIAEVIRRHSSDLDAEDLRDIAENIEQTARCGRGGRLMARTPAALMAVPVLLACTVLYAAGIGILVMQHQLQGLVASVIVTLSVLGLLWRWSR